MSSTANIRSLLSRIRKLEREVVVLRSENELLKSKLGPARWRFDGRKAEQFIQTLIGGEIKRRSSPFDLILPSGKTFEIKYSNLNPAVDTEITLRWNWRHILGSNGSKRFDQLLLLGTQDPQYRNYYDDPESPCVIFDVPFRDVDSLMCGSLIWINTNPVRFRRAVHRELICKYQITRKALVERYRERVGSEVDPDPRRVK